MSAKTISAQRTLSWGRMLLWGLALWGLVAAIYRLTNGLGASTNLSDGRPWGLWISIDVLAGIALAAGGFTIGAIVKIFHMKRFYPLLRPTILTAFLGYVIGAASIFFDLGLPWRIWHPLVYHNLHSPLFEVAVCVMTYTTVLALELSEVVFEGLGWRTLRRLVGAIMIPLVILGIVLSTMHQSSLGTLFVLSGWRVSPLWRTGFLPLLFFLSAVAAGLSMIIVEANLAARAYHKKLDQPLLAELGKYAAWVLLVYAIIKAATFVMSGGLAALGENLWLTLLFLVEVIVGVLIPLVMLFSARVREDRHLLFRAAFLVAFGVLLNRFNVSLFGLKGVAYVPTWAEWGITLGMMAGAILFFDFMVRHFPIFEKGH
ncbi:MAG: Ni/Fe-hydrogenase cytochrome b subunit [Chloroflexi bacterium]|nr:Ni/Fe-hydrogenase cytochrome b subunit [Chloroflexota bacterium]